MKTQTQRQILTQIRALIGPYAGTSSAVDRIKSNPTLCAGELLIAFRLLAALLNELEL